MMVEGKTRRRGDHREVPATCRSIAPTGSNPVQHRRLQYFQAQFAGTYTAERAFPHESTHNSCATSTREVGGLSSGGQAHAIKLGRGVVHCLPLGVLQRQPRARHYDSGCSTRLDYRAGSDSS